MALPYSIDDSPIHNFIAVISRWMSVTKVTNDNIVNLDASKLTGNMLTILEFFRELSVATLLVEVT